MSIGMIVLTVTAILVFFGIAQRVLDKLYLSDRSALTLIALMFFGTFIPNITFGHVQFSVGGALIPLGICLYLLVRAGTARERIRALLGSIIAAGVIYGLSRFIPAEPEAIPIDPMYLYGIAGGLIAYLFGRSRRGAFICGVLGIALADIVTSIGNWRRGIDQPLILGGAGVFDVMVLSGIIGVLIAELVGEIMERIARGSKQPAHTPIENPIRHKER